MFYVDNVNKKPDTSRPAGCNNLIMKRISDFVISINYSLKILKIVNYNIIPYFVRFHLEQKLETLDKIRDEILKSPGNTTLKMSKTGDTDVNVLFEKIRLASTNKLGGLVLKTYDSDIFNNWVKTDWIDGENGISKVTALKPDENGTITMDALNLLS